jgi:hypothetical protein
VLRAGPGATTTTDADGRFMVTTTASTRIRYRVSHQDHETRVEQMSLTQDAAARGAERPVWRSPDRGTASKKKPAQAGFFHWVCLLTSAF